MTNRTTAFAASCSAVGLLSLMASAAVPAGDPSGMYPNRPVRVIVPFTPGGQPDIFARMVGEKLTLSLGQPIVVDNRAGAGGMTGSKTVVDANPDGYTLLANSSSHAIAPAVRKLPFDVTRDFAGISMLYNAAYLLVVPPSLAVKTTQDLVSLAKAKPGQLNFGSAGVGSGTHFAAEMFKYAAKVDIVHVAYKGIPEAMTDTMANRVQLFMAPLPSSIGLVKEGKLRALGVTSPARLPLNPDIPTIAEAGFPGFRWDSWGGLFAPARTPRAIMSRLNRDVVSILNQPDIQKRMRTLGAEPAPTTAAELDKHVAQELAMVFKLAKAAGLEPQ